MIGIFSANDVFQAAENTLFVFIGLLRLLRMLFLPFFASLDDVSFQEGETRTSSSHIIFFSFAFLGKSEKQRPRKHPSQLFCFGFGKHFASFL